MVERAVTIKLALQDGIGDRLLEVLQQLNALKGKSAKATIRLDLQGQDAIRSAQAGLSKTRQASDEVGQSSRAAIKELGALGGAITSKTITPLLEYQKLWGGSLQVARMFGSGAITALKGASTEFQKQKDLAAFWGTSGYINRGVDVLKSSLGSMLSGSGSGFTSWLQGGIKSLEQYRTALAGAAVGMAAFGVAAAMRSKTTANYIESSINSLSRKIADTGQAKEWIEKAQKTDWSMGRESRLGVYETVLNKSRLRGKDAQDATEDIEKYWFANQENLKKKGFGSAESLTTAITAPELMGDEASKLDAIFGLGFSKRSATARMGWMGHLSEGINMDKAVADRPDVVMSKRLVATTAAAGDAILPVLNTLLGGFLKISDAVGSIPGLGSMIGWGAVLTTAAAAGLILLSMLGGMIANLQILSGVLKLGRAAQIAYSMATGVVTAAQALATGGAYAMAAGVWAAIAPMLPFIAAGALIAGVLGLMAYKAGILGSLLKGFQAIELGKVFEDLQKGDVGGAWKDLTKGFKLPSLKEAWGNLTSGLALPDLGKMWGGVAKGFQWPKMPSIKLLSIKLPNIKDLTKLPDMLPKGALKIGLDILTAASPLGMSIKVALMVVDFLRKLWFNSNALNKLFGTGVDLWTKTRDFLAWIQDLIKSIISKLTSFADQILGVFGVETTEGAKRRQTEYSKEAKNEEAKYGIALPSGSKIIAPGGQEFGVDQYKDLLNRYGGALSSWSVKTSSGQWNSLGQYMKTNPATGEAGELYQKAPPLTNAFSGIGTIIGEAIKAALTGSGDNTPPQSTPAVPSNVPGSAPRQGSSPPGTGAGSKGGLGVPSVAPSNAFESSAENPYVPSYAVGVTFQKGGLFKGNVHASEELVDQATSIRGPGVISRAIEMLNAAISSVKGISGLASGGQIKVSGPLIGHSMEEVDTAAEVQKGPTTLTRINEMFSKQSFSGLQPTSVHNSPIFNMNIERVDNKQTADYFTSKVREVVRQEMDDDKLLFRVRNKLGGNQTREIGYLRG